MDTLGFAYPTESFRSDFSLMLNYINEPRRRLDDLRRIAKSKNEGALPPAFAGLLEACGQEHN